MIVLLQQFQLFTNMYHKMLASFPSSCVGMKGKDVPLYSYEK